MTSTSTESIEVFIVYADADQDKILYEELEKHLSSLKRDKSIKTWNKYKIIGGQEVQKEIDAHLNRSGVILLLVSPDFMNSDYIWNNNMTRAMERHGAGKACVIPILLRDVDYTNAPFEKLQFLPKNGKSVTSLPNQDEVLKSIAVEIRGSVKSLVAEPTYSAPEDITPQQEQLQDKVTELINESNILFKEGKLKEAIVKCNDAIRLDPKNVYAYRKLAEIHYESKDYKGAIEDVNKAIELTPKDANAYEARASLYYELKDYKRAIEDFNTAIQLMPNNADYYMGLWFVHNELKDYKGAIEDLNKLIQMDPNYANFYRLRWQAHCELKDYKGAIEDANTLIQLKDAYSYRFRFFARYELKDYKGAIEDANTLIQLDLIDADIYYRRGMVHKALGDKKEAAKDFQKAANLYQKQGKPKDYQDALDQKKALGWWLF